MYKVYSFLISLYPPRAPRRKKRCANREVKGGKTTAFVDLKTLKFRKWFKYRLKAQKFQKQHALKGQKLLAQGSALGIMAVRNAPCKGNSLINCLEFLKLLPLQGVWDKTCETSVKSPLEKVIFVNFFICNHLIIKWHFVGKRTKNYFLKWTQ